MIQKTDRKFLQNDIKVTEKKDIEPYFDTLKNAGINSVDDLKEWWANRSELEAFLEENLAWRYIKMSCHSENKEYEESFNFFVSQIEPMINEYDDILDRKLLESPFIDELDKEKYFIPVRAKKKAVEIFRKENIPIIAKLNEKSQEYGKITGSMTVTYQEEEMTLQKARNFLKSTDRSERQAVYELINERYAKDADKLDKLLEDLSLDRQKVAENAGFENFRDYMFASLKRFDYTKEDCFKFHEAVQKTIIPVLKDIHLKRKEALPYSDLKPFDLEVDVEMREGLKAFSSTEDFIKKTIEVFTRVRPKYGEFLQTMNDNGYWDLDSRKGKRPGGYNYPLYESNIPFIFMNATGNQRDLETMMHEGGHAVHSFLSKDLELTDFKGLSSEIAELASMSMELISMKHWNVFYPNHDDLKRAKQHLLEGILKVLPWIATVDKFQHKIYEDKDMTIEKRKEIWTEIINEFSTGVVNYEAYEDVQKTQWHRQLHIFEVPFYYIEYGFAQLGAVAIWKRYSENPEQALDDYEAALKLGYSKPISEIYKTAGIEFRFDHEYVAELMNFVQSELQKL